MKQSLEGQRIGPYELSARIGAGGMGEVYKARDTRLNRTVAVKVLPDGAAADPEFRERFEREARAVAALNHPHICVLYDVGSHEGMNFLVMEHLDGRTLAARVAEGPVSPEEALRYATQIASALERAHRAGVIHRDLKPANIMLTEVGAKLLDFGLAKIVDADTDVTRTQEGTVLGTAAYMSPEQAEGKPLDARSDVFSFGTVVYEMVSGRRAFAGQTTVQVLSAVLRDDPLPLASSSQLSSVVRRCLAKEPGERFQSMSEVRAALERSGVSPVKELPSIAVLPFANMSADPENEYFSDGLAEEIINALTRIDGLHVAARTSSFSFKGKSIDVSEMARRLNVRHVLEGGVRKAGGRVRVTVQLVDAANGYQLWSDRYDRELADIFDVQDEIARSIVAKLRVALDTSPGQAARLVKATTGNMEAYQQYLKGRAMLYRRGPWIARALESFQTAVVLDSEYAQAWAGVADAYTALCYSGYRRPDQTMPAAMEAANRATHADPESAEAHNALAIVALLWERDFPKAEREFLEALRLNPQYLQARCWYGLFFLQWGVGRLEEGLAETLRAFEADPLSGYAMMVVSFALATVQRFDEAVIRAQAAVPQDPESFVARWELGYAYHWNGQHQEAADVLEPMWADSGHSWVALGLAPAYASLGRGDDVQAMFDRLLARRSTEYVPPFVLAECVACLGDIDRAIAYCEEAVEARDMLFALFHRWLPDFGVVRADARFASIVARFNARGRH